MCLNYVLMNCAKVHKLIKITNKKPALEKIKAGFPIVRSLNLPDP
jgi:hypothetical protein